MLLRRLWTWTFEHCWNCQGCGDLWRWTQPNTGRCAVSDTFGCQTRVDSGWFIFAVALTEFRITQWLWACFSEVNWKWGSAHAYSRDSHNKSSHWVPAPCSLLPDLVNTLNSWAKIKFSYLKKTDWYEFLWLRIFLKTGMTVLLIINSTATIHSFTMIISF